MVKLILFVVLFIFSQDVFSKSTMCVCIDCKLSSHSEMNEDTIQGVELILVVESFPIFKGDLLKFIQSQINYPETAKKDSIEGVVYVSYWVEITGATTNHKVAKGIREDLDEEALRITELLMYEKPAMQGGEPVRLQYTLPVIFTLSEPIKKKRCLRKKKKTW